MQLKWWDLVAELGDDKRHALCHQPADEMHVARQPIQFRDYDLSAETLSFEEGRLKLRPLAERIGSSAALDFDKAIVILLGAYQGDVLALGKAADCVDLRPAESGHATVIEVTFFTETAAGVWLIRGSWRMRSTAKTMWCAVPQLTMSTAPRSPSSA